MGDEFYAALKLITGEEIFSLISVDENEGDPIILLQNPIIIKNFTTPGGSFVKIKPWMEIPNDDFFIIKSDKVITVTEITDSPIIRIYEKYLEDNENDNSELLSDNQTKITNKMGFISTVDDARKKLERIFKDLKES